MKAPYSQDLINILSDPQSKKIIDENRDSLEENSYLLIKKDNKYYRLNSNLLKSSEPTKL